MGTWSLVFGFSPVEFWQTTAPEFEALTQEFLERNKPEQEGMDYSRFLELERKISQNANR